MERQKLLQVLYDALPDKSKVSTGRRVTTIEQEHSSGIVCAHVTTNEGQEVHTGDLLVGADGVRSLVRQEMWSQQSPRTMEHC